MFIVFSWLVLLFLVSLCKFRLLKLNFNFKFFFVILVELLCCVGVILIDNGFSIWVSIFLGLGVLFIVVDCFRVELLVCCEEVSREEEELLDISDREDFLGDIFGCCCWEVV